MGGVEDSVVIAIDIGSSSLRCTAYMCSYNVQDKVDVTLQAVGSRNLVFDVLACGKTVEGVHQIIKAIEETLSELLAKLSSVSPLVPISAVGFASFAMCLVGVTETGEPASHLLTYNDNSNGEPSRQIFNDLQRSMESPIHKRTGVYSYHNSYAPAQLLNFHETYGHDYPALSSFTTLASLCVSKWTGRIGKPVISTSEASWTGLYNAQENNWDSELLRLLPDKVSSQLPLLAEYSTPAGRFSPHFVGMWPALSTCTLFYGVGDGAAANIGSGCRERNKIALTIGTSAAVRVVVDSDVPNGDIPDGLWSYSIDAKRRLVGGALTDGGSVFAWLKKLLSLDDDTVIHQSEPDAHGLTILPFWSGERSIGWHSGMTATITGLKKETKAHDILRAGLESVAYRIRTIFNALKEVLPDERVIVTSGGALEKSTQWQQIIADVLQEDLTVSEIPEATSRGVTILVVEALAKASGTLVRISDSGVPSRLVSHNPRFKEVYESAFHRQCELYNRMVGQPLKLPTGRKSSPKKIPKRNRLKYFNGPEGRSLRFSREAHHFAVRLTSKSRTTPCVLCGGGTQYACNVCTTPLHVSCVGGNSDPCFKLFHEERHLDKRVRGNDVEDK